MTRAQQQTSFFDWVSFRSTDALKQLLDIDDHRQIRNPGSRIDWSGGPIPRHLVFQTMVFGGIKSVMGVAPFRQ